MNTQNETQVTEVDQQPGKAKISPTIMQDIRAELLKLPYDELLNVRDYVIFRKLQCARRQAQQNN